MKFYFFLFKIKTMGDKDMISNYLAIAIGLVVLGLICLVVWLNNKEDAEIQKTMKR